MSFPGIQPNSSSQGAAFSQRSAMNRVPATRANTPSLQFGGDTVHFQGKGHGVGQSLFRSSAPSGSEAIRQENESFSINILDVLSVGTMIATFLVQTLGRQNKALLIGTHVINALAVGAEITSFFIKPLRNKFSLQLWGPDKGKQSTSTGPAGNFGTGSLDLSKLTPKQIDILNNWIANHPEFQR